ncbi:hypothetical protein [Novosphingobium sp.]|uniref:hypothetical protein n=1 Tax=Novosphingobium sp. TaxID=1874826 RepID=UPI0025E35EBB|nr:hypothetical protein [Novosphingobium sp.]
MDMTTFLAAFVDLLLKSAIAAFVLNEVRGIVLAGPVLYGMYQAGGTLMAIWLGFCSLAGITLSVVVPLFVDKRFRIRERLRAAVKPA